MDTASLQDQDERLRVAVCRSLHEIGLARLEDRAQTALFEANTSHSFDFFRLADIALFNDRIARAIRVLERNSKSAGFWFIQRCLDNRPGFSSSANLASLNGLADKLKAIRNDTHFHLNRDGIKNPQEVWQKAGITVNEFRDGMDQLWKYLNHAYEFFFKENFPWPEYDGSDIGPIVKLAEEKGLLL